MKKCDICKQEKRNVSREPSRSQLLFGGFNMRTENRCPACEREVMKWVDSLITTMVKTGDIEGA